MIYLSAMTTTERDDLVAHEGDVIYNATLREYQLRHNNTWMTLQLQKFTKADLERTEPILTYNNTHVLNKNQQPDKSNPLHDLPSGIIIVILAILLLSTLWF